MSVRCAHDRSDEIKKIEKENRSFNSVQKSYNVTVNICKVMEREKDSDMIECVCVCEIDG